MYNVIFDGQEIFAELFNIMEEISLIPPLLKSLDYFKHHDSYTYRHMLGVYALSVLPARDLIPEYKDRIGNIATGHIK